MNLWIGIGICGSIGLASIGTSLGAIPRPGDDRWWFHVGAGGSTLAHSGFYLCVAVLIAGWLGVGYQPRQGGLTVSRAWVILALWGLPLLVGPPLFSRDIYSYIGQGLLAHHGLNPYSVPPSALGNGPLLASIASVWRDTASPYGPLFVTVSRAAASVSGGSLVVQVMVFRLMELIGVVLIMFSLPQLARRMGADPGLALWLGALSPLALFSFIASGHNDALMVGLLLAGVTLATGTRLALGLSLCALAATIKLPAAAAIVFIAVDRLRRAEGPDRRRIFLDAVVVPVPGHRRSDRAVRAGLDLARTDRPPGADRAEGAVHTGGVARSLRALDPSLVLHPGVPERHRVGDPAGVRSVVGGRDRVVGSATPIGSTWCACSDWRSCWS